MKTITDHQQAPPDDRLDGPVHTWFELTYSNYLVLPRTLMQSMPIEWQERMVACLRELDDAFGHLEHPDAYEVTAGEEREIGELTDAERRFLGVDAGVEPDLDDEDDDRERTFWYRGQEYQAWERIVFPKADPVPHYNRGRTYIEPRIA